MSKELTHQLIHDPDAFKHHDNLQFLGEKLYAPNLWHLNRRTIALAFAVGLFYAWTPTPMQMVIAAIGAIYYRTNLPISVAQAWITNPITIPPLFYFSYQVGLWFLSQSSSPDDSKFSLSTLLSGLGDVWQPLLVGCFIMGIISSAIGYFGMHYYWQYHINKKWAERKAKRLSVQD
jgi:uncharacterized protein (DUF2062 family)